MDEKTCIERLSQYLLKTKDSEAANIRAIRQQVRGWFEGVHEAKGKSLDHLAAFFAAVWPQEDRPFDPKWLCMSVDELQNENYMKAVYELKRFTGIFKPYQEYVDTVKDDSLKGLCIDHEYDFYLYRMHSSKKLARDVLRVKSHGRGHVVAELYQYSEHFTSIKIRETSIKTYKGFGFFYQQRLFYLIFMSPTKKDGPEPSFLILNIDDKNMYVEGTISGISDNHSPSCGVILREKCEKRLDDPKEYVGVLEKFNVPLEKVREIKGKMEDLLKIQVDKYKEKSPE
ncbi:hypothetical protein MishRS11D_46560 (plasmid) [Methylomagnum ishizawai]|nr:hypothetical protein MishRS11D_46560 [Methylomagnum ishizawai]